MEGAAPPHALIRTRLRPHVDLWRYHGCRAGTRVMLYDVLDGGHTIPGTPVIPALVPIVGPTNQELDTPDAIWSFVSRFRLPRHRRP